MYRIQHQRNVRKDQLRRRSYVQRSGKRSVSFCPDTKTQISNQVYQSEPFIITVPGNYDGQIIWNVTAEPKFKNESIPPITTNTPPVSEEPSGDKSSRTPNVKTGDDTNVIMWLSLMGISLVIFSICKRKVHK